MLKTEKRRNILKVFHLYLSDCLLGYFSAFDIFSDYTRSYLTVRIVWYTPCGKKNQSRSRFLNIFSVDMWICFVLSLVLTVITVSCISNYVHKSHLHESKSYSNISSVTANIIAVSLSVSVNTQPRSTPLRLFFFCWVCYSVAISTVFRVYLNRDTRNRSEV
jgi:beta-lactamase regulating signal transducer with metallopeptidase domain